MVTIIEIRRLCEQVIEAGIKVRGGPSQEILRLARSIWFPYYRALGLTRDEASTQVLARAMEMEAKVVMGIAGKTQAIHGPREVIELLEAINRLDKRMTKERAAQNDIRRRAREIGLIE